MLTNNKSLQGMVIRATDGEIGAVDDLYFDDQLWMIRYLTVKTGSWLDDRDVLVSPLSIIKLDWEMNRLEVALTRKQVEASPDVNLHMPVSRQHEAEYLDYYGRPHYWIDADAPASMPSTVAGVDTAPLGSGDSHLRDCDAVEGYDIEAVDGEIGHLEQLIIDDQSWTIRYLEVATKNWWPGKKVLLSPEWVERMSWLESKVFVAVTREALTTCPEYDESVPITRDYENAIYSHYGRPPYWSGKDHRSEEIRRSVELAFSAGMPHE